MNLRNIGAKRLSLIMSSWSWATIWRLFLYTIIPYGIFSQYLSWAKVASCSMTPTILTHDATVLVKYNIRVYDIINSSIGGIPIIGNILQSNFFHKFSPLVHKYKILSQNIITFKKIEIGDIVVFQTPGDESAYTKRIIAGPGDTVQQYYGYYFVNGKQLKYTYKGQIKTSENNLPIVGDMWEETSCDGRKTYNILMTRPVGSYKDISDVFIVPEDSYFVSGDNRHNSDDGRSMLSFIHKDHIDYRVILNVFSNAKLTTLDLYEWVKSIRKEYCLKVL